MEFSRDNLHHAYLIKGRGGAVDVITSFLEEAFGISAEGNPDVIKQTFDSMGIDDARWLKEEVQLRPLSGDHRFYIITTNSITIPAQNALLKTLEEPTAGSHLFLIIPRSDTLLPTLLSRVEIKTSSDEITEDVEVFLSESKPARLEMVADMLKEDSEQDPARFISALEKYIHTLWENKREQKWEQALREIVMTERYIYDSSASAKFLLEHLALTLPTL